MSDAVKKQLKKIQNKLNSLYDTINNETQNDSSKKKILGFIKSIRMKLDDKIKLFNRPLFDRIDEQLEKLYGYIKEFQLTDEGKENIKQIIQYSIVAIEALLLFYATKKIASYRSRSRRSRQRSRSRT